MLLTTDVRPLAFAGTFAVAIFLALSFIAIGRHLAREKSLYASGLIFSAVVYPVLTLAGIYRGNFWLEAVGLFVFLTIALIGCRLHRRWLAFGWAGHATWDVLFPSAPWWYIHGCIAFDLFLAGYIVGQIPGGLTQRTNQKSGDLGHADDHARSIR